MKKFRIIILILGILFTNAELENSAQIPNDSIQNEAECSEGNEKNNNNSYGKFLEKSELLSRGLFNIYRTDEKYFFEVPDKVLDRDMLLGSRIAALSSTSKVVAGEMRKSPILIRFSRDDKNVYLHQITSDYLADESDEIMVAVKRNSIVPILNTFPIEYMNNDSTTAVIDVTRFFSTEISPVSPFNSRFKAGKLETDATRIVEGLSFPENVEMRTQMSYSNNNGEPFLILMHRSILLLPEEPMKPRYEDPRIGYFTNSMRYFSSEKIGVESLSYISRFNIYPREEDIEKYKSGEMIEPAKPIIFYIDNAFPEEWRPYLKAGIQDWQKAFEAIGFKNAILAKDYPEDDPDFHPEDIRYSCFRYISTPKANSMGPRWIDPRSGEIIGGDVLWWHNVTELLRDWRFVQCGAAEPEARKQNPDMKILGEMIRYVAAHEVGHTLGLKHNMRASYAFPVDSLRSATFTQKNGTTPSIMDYARFNYIAQPGDKAVRMTPPHMGPYDIYAIQWGYKPIFGAATPKEEKSILNQWILEKSDDLRYRYGDQQMGISFDPASQNEALGNCAIKASKYGVANARFIMDHLVEWTTEPNGDFDFLIHMYGELIKQYERYLTHVTSYLGGVYIYKLVEGEDKEYYNPVSREKQKEALAWLFNELRTQDEWILNKDVEKRIGAQKTDLFKSQAERLDHIMSPVVFRRLELYHSDYSYNEYLDDLHNLVWSKNIKKKDIDPFERNLQANYIRNLLNLAGEKPGSSKKSSLASDEEALGSTNSSKTSYIDNLLEPLLYQKIEETKKILKKRQRTLDPELKAHYHYLYELIQD